MSRLPSAAASRNMSACSAQAMSQVGCRLMVASSANTSRPLAPLAWGDIARALATKAAISADADVSDDVSPGARAPTGTSGAADLGLTGSLDIWARWLPRAYVARDQARVNAAPAWSCAPTRATAHVPPAAV